MKKIINRLWFTFFATKPKIKLKQKDKYRIYFWYTSDGQKIERNGGLGFGLWCMSNPNKEIAIMALNRF